MNIIQTINGKSLTIALEGQLDSTTAPELEAIIRKSLQGIEELVFDFSALEYLSSAGLRILLVSKKIMDKQGKMILKGVREEVMEVFDITGFSSILDFA